MTHSSSPFASQLGVEPGREMPLTIPVAHDFICPWCWIGLFQARRLQEEFGATIEWRAYELFPEGMDYPAATPPEPQPKNKPAVPSRLDFLAIADGIEVPDRSRPRGIKTTKAHLACIAARAEGKEDELVEAIYRAYWERGESIDREDVLRRIVATVVEDADAVMRCVRNRCGMDEIVPYDDEAYATGVYNVPTFFIGEQRLAEQPYINLKRAVEKAQRLTDVSEIYRNLDFGPAPEDRPYVIIDMISTIDGKTVSGTEKEPVSDLGSDVDHALMRRIESQVDAIILGAGSLRATSKKWVPQAPIRVVVTRSGDLPYDAGFFAGPGAYVAVSGSGNVRLPAGVNLLRAGHDEVDLPFLLRRLRSLGVERLLLFGGSELNAEFLRQDLVDELFLTLAPKIKLGRCLPTFAGGEPLDRYELKEFEIREHHVIGNEIFLRYGRAGA